MLPSALVSVDSNQNALCTVVNLSDSEINIEQPKVNLEEILDSHTVNTINKQTYVEQPNRSDLLVKNLRISHLNSEEKTSFEHLSEIQSYFSSCR